MRFRNKAFEIHENSIKCYLPTINSRRKTIVNPFNFNIEKRYKIVFFYLRCKLYIRMLAVKVTSKISI